MNNPNEQLNRARKAGLILGLMLVMFSMWGILYNQNVSPDNYAVVMAIGALTIGISKVNIN